MWGYKQPKVKTKKHIKPRPLFEYVRNMRTGEVFRVLPNFQLQQVRITPLGYRNVEL